MTSLLARPRWRIGQVLLPDHFKGLESALACEAAIRASTAGLPTTGVLRLDWNGPAPEHGVLWVSALTAILPDGLLVDIPGNASVTAPLDLKLPGRPLVTVYAHVFLEEEASVDGALEPAPKAVPRCYHQVRLTTEAAAPASQGRICLGEFLRGDDGTFRLLKKAVPPLLGLESTPYFQDELKQVRNEILEFESVLDESAASALSRGESLLAVQRSRIEARKLVALLDDAAGGVQHHPYVLFAALRAFAVELCILDDSAMPWRPPAYDHNDQRRCFDLVFAELTNKLRAPLPESPCVSFELENGRWIVSIPSDAGAAQELFIAVRKLRATERDPLEGVRLASPERLRHVRERVLRGVRLVYQDRPPFRHAFGAAVDFYRILAPMLGEESPEWAYVVHEQALAFYHEPRFDGYRFLLCWRPRP